MLKFGWMRSRGEVSVISAGRGDGVDDGTEIALGYLLPWGWMWGWLGSEGVGGSYSAPDYKTRFSFQRLSLSIHQRTD